MPSKGPSQHADSHRVILCGPRYASAATAIGDSLRRASCREEQICEPGLDSLGSVREANRVPEFRGRINRQNRHICPRSSFSVRSHKPSLVITPTPKPLAIGAMSSSSTPPLEERKRVRPHNIVSRCLLYQFVRCLTCLYGVIGQTSIRYHPINWNAYPQVVVQSPSKLHAHQKVGP